MKFNIDSYIRNDVKSISRQNSNFERKQFLRMDKNENLFDLDMINQKELQALVTSDLISSYPNLDHLYARISTFFGVDTNTVLLTAGADAAIKSVYETFVNRGDQVILPEYSYGMHQVYMNQFGAKATRIMFDKDLSLTSQQIENIDKKIKLVFLESPSGSSGISIKEINIQNLAKRLIDLETLLVVDETYSPIVSDYLSATVFQNNSNLLAIRSFSKNIGLAGLRVGMIMGNKQSISWLKLIKPMYEINSFAASVLDFYLTNSDVLMRYREQIAASRTVVAANIDNDEFDVIFGDANFFLLKPKHKKSITLNLFLQNNGILIKDQFRVGSLEGYFRITFASEKITDNLISLLHNYATLPAFEM